MQHFKEIIASRDATLREARAEELTAARAAERAKIVAWLREWAITQKLSQYAVRRQAAAAMETLVAAVEGGEHEGER